MLKRLWLIILMAVVSGCSMNSGRIRLLNYDVATAIFGNVPDAVTVSKGDTLYSISRRYDVPLRDLITLNQLVPPYTLSVGQVIRIPSARYHIVEKGDTLYSISKRYEVDLTTLSKLNHITPPYTLAIGQRLDLPGSISSHSDSGSGYSAQDTTVWYTPKKTQTSTFKATTAKKTVKKASSVKKSTSAKTSAVKKKAPAKKTPTKRTVVQKRTSKFSWPVKGKVISKFGSIGKGRTNDGINIRAAKGTAVKAADKGTVVYAGNELKGFGNLILVKHSGGWITAYAHNQKLLVKKGQKVVKGEKIATVGDTGGVNEPQLHFEVRAGKKAVNPLTYLP